MPPKKIFFFLLCIFYIYNITSSSKLFQKAKDLTNLASHINRDLRFKSPDSYTENPKNAIKDEVKSFLYSKNLFKIYLEKIKKIFTDLF